MVNTPFRPLFGSSSRQQRGSIAVPMRWRCVSCDHPSVTTYIEMRASYPVTDIPMLDASKRLAFGERSSSEPVLATSLKTSNFVETI